MQLLLNTTVITEVKNKDKRTNVWRAIQWTITRISIDYNDVHRLHCDEISLKTYVNAYAKWKDVLLTIIQNAIIWITPMLLQHSHGSYNTAQHKSNATISIER